MSPGVYTLRVRNLGDTEPARLVDGYTVLAADAEDLWSAAEDLWTDPQTVYAGDSVELSLNVHRHTQGNGAAPRAVAVRFYRQLGPAQASSAGDTSQLIEIGRATTDPIATGDSVASVTVPWSTAGLADTVTIVAIIDPENQVAEATKSNNRVTRTLTLQPPPGDGSAPVITSLVLNGGTDGAIGETTSPDITVTLAAEDDSGGVSAMYLVERAYVLSAHKWVAVQSTGWLRFASPFTLTLTPNGGMRYIQAWVSDGAGNVSQETVMAGINYNPPASSILGGEVHLYRRTLAAGDVRSFRAVIEPTVPLSRRIFETPTQHYKAGVVFLAWLNGHQAHFTMPAGMQSARGLLHYADVFRLADQANVLDRPDLAVERMSSFMDTFGIARPPRRQAVA